MRGCLMTGFWLSALTRNVKKIINLSSEVPEIILYCYYLILFSSNTLFFSFKLMSFSLLFLSLQTSQMKPFTMLSFKVLNLLFVC